MTTRRSDCILALDLGTTAFKAAWVDADLTLGPVVERRIRLDKNGDTVTCPPDRYAQTALAALRDVRERAESLGLRPNAIGITSQAQTFVTLDSSGKAVGPAVVWTDARAAAETEEAACALPDFAVTSGFIRPSPLQFLPKVLRARRENPHSHRYLLLNEWTVFTLTGEPLGDSNQQGMGGFWNISNNTWNGRALDLAGIGPDNLAVVGPAGALSATLDSAARRVTGLPALPVFSCGNDQGCAAIGAGLESAGELFCNFGTAMVIYGLSGHPMVPANDSQIAGISTLPALWFLLGVEPECGNVLDELASTWSRGSGVDEMIKRAVNDGGAMPEVRAALDTYAARFAELLTAVSSRLGRPGQLFVGGGLSRSRAWIRLLEQRSGALLTPCGMAHPGLRGVAKVIRLATGGGDGAPV